MQRFKQILVEEAAWDYPMTRRVLARLPGVPVKVIADREALRPREVSPAQWLGESKTTLLLAVQKGPFWRACPGTRDYICCGYQVLQVALNCPFDCTYCILQSYVNVPAVTVFVNIEDLESELRATWAETPHRTWRLGTGEFGDSLALDRQVPRNGWGNPKPPSSSPCRKALSGGPAREPGTTSAAAIRSCRWP